MARAENVLEKEKRQKKKKTQRSRRIKGKPSD